MSAFFSTAEPSLRCFSHPADDFLSKKPSDSACSAGLADKRASILGPVDHQPATNPWIAVFSSASIPVRLSVAPPNVAADTQTAGRPATLGPNPATIALLCG